MPPEREGGRTLSEAPPPWYRGLPTLTTEVACDGQRHRITWREGELRLEDHDALAEQSLAALGGTPPICVELLEAWRAERGSEHLLELFLARETLSPDDLTLRKRRHEAELESARRMALPVHGQLGAGPEGIRRARLRERQAQERVEREQRAWRDSLIDLLSPGLRRALALSMVAAIEQRWHEDRYRQGRMRDAERALEGLAKPLLSHVARGWSRDLTPYRDFEVTARLLAPGEEPSCTLWADRRIVYATLSLPLSWFTEVWAQGISLVDGCFVMSVSETCRDRVRLRVLAVRLEGRHWKTRTSLEEPALVTRGRAGQWRLQWL